LASNICQALSLAAICPTCAADDMSRALTGHGGKAAPRANLGDLCDHAMLKRALHW